MFKVILFVALSKFCEMAATKKEAVVAFDLFVETYGVKYERAVKKLTKDRDVLLTFYGNPPLFNAKVEMAFLQFHTPNITSPPAPVAPLADPKRDGAGI